VPSLRLTSVRSRMLFVLVPLAALAELKQLMAQFRV
jgi:hypothetical protein